MMKQIEQIFVDPKNDVAFKKLFGDKHHKSLTMNFLNSILNLSGNDEIEKIEFLDTKMVPDNILGKNIYLDVFCHDAKGKQFIIEMQSLNEYNFIQRSHMYAARVLSSQLSKGGHYQDLIPVIFLGIVNYTLFEHDADIISHYAIMNTKTMKIPNNSLLTWHYVELSKFKIKLNQVDKLQTMNEKWFYFLKYADDLKMVPNSLSELKEAFEVVEKMRWSQADLLTYSQAEDKIGRERRQQEGSHSDGLKEGLEQGALKKAEAMAIKLLHKNISTDEIADLTELTIDQIDALRKKLN